MVIYIYIYTRIYTTTQYKLLKRKWSMYVRQWVEGKDNQHKLQQVTQPPVQGVFVPMAEGKYHQRKLQPVTTTMCASRIVALVDRRLTPQVQGAIVRSQGAKVRTEGGKVRTSISASR